MYYIILYIINMTKTHRRIPDTQSYFEVFFHKYSPQHVSHGDGDGDDDRRRCLESPAVLEAGDPPSTKSRRQCS